MILEDKTEERLLFRDTPNLNSLVDYSSYCDSLANLIGCSPIRARLLFHPRLCSRVWLGSQIPSQYRLYGPHSDFKAAEHVIMKLPFVYMPYATSFKILLSVFCYFSKKCKTYLAKKYTPLVKNLIKDYVKENGGEAMNMD